MPANFAVHYAIQLASGLPYVPMPPADSWWDVWGKVIAPPIITGLIAVAGFCIAFYVNDRTKRVEIFYKEQLEAVRAIVASVHKLSTDLTNSAGPNKPYSNFTNVANEYKHTFKETILLRMPILHDKSRVAIIDFNNSVEKLIEVREILERTHGNHTQEDRDKLTKSYEDTRGKLVKSAFELTDVLYRDLRYPGRTTLSSDLKEFDKRFKRRLKEEQTPKSESSDV